jgi:PAS domain S-box-containing protein
MDHPAWSSYGNVEALAELATDALVLVDTDGRLLIVNTLTEQLFGYQRGELVGQLAEMLVPERYRATQGPHLAAYLASPHVRAMDRSLDIVGRRNDGSEFPADITLRPLQTQSGIVVLAAIRDITERKRLEDERVALLAREQAARAEAKTAVRLRDAFLAAATHDLRNPLTAIKVRADILQLLSYQLAPQEAADQVRSAAARIVETSNRMAAILQQLMDLARLHMGQPLLLERAPTDLVALAQRAVAEHQEATGQHVLRLQVQEQKLVGVWDAGRLERVLDNLLDNAIKYSPRGGEVTVSLARDGTSAVLTVSDNGLGIPASDVPNMFEWFRRGSNVATTMPGTGLGLAGVRQIVEQHGGTISVETREHEGSSFTLRLPLAGD